jgi:hypothetical protein
LGISLFVCYRNGCHYFASCSIILVISLFVSY